MRRTYELDYPFELDPHEVRALIGGKAANLARMLGPDLRLPVPPGFAITTATCREVLATRLARGPRRRAPGADGRGRGDDRAPVRRPGRPAAGHPSAPARPVSMPGMMDTILNLGLTPATTEGLARVTGDPAFAAACRDRLETMFASIVGVEPVPDDPWQQLRLAIEAVFRSWNSDRAIAYRRREGIPDDLGTAVTVQAMVFGNRGDDSATGVAFTRNPATGEPVLYGDVLFDAQGEDVVAGTHRTEPIAVLDTRLPEAAALAARGRDPARAPPPRPVRHRVHDRAGPPVAAAGPGGQAEPPGGAPDRGRHGQRPLVRAVASRGGRTRRPAARRSAHR